MAGLSNSGIPHVEEATGGPAIAEGEDMTGNNWKIPDKGLDAAIKNWCKDLTAEAQDAGTLPAHVEEEILAVVNSLGRVKHSSVCITGEPGTGKSTILRYVAQYIAGNKDLPESLRDARILMVDLDHMNAGAKFRGQFEERLKPLLDGIAEREGRLDGRKIILAFDDFAAVMGAGMPQGGASVVNMIKPFLTAKGVTVLAAGTPQDYKRLIDSDPALSRRFDQVAVVTGEQRMMRKAESLAEIFLKGAAQPVRIMPAIVYRQKPVGHSFIV